MTKEEYLKRLQYELQALPHEEQAEAMNYYRSYFEDAGDEKTADVIDELGPPEKLGAYIRSNFTCVPGEKIQKRKKSGGTNDGRNSSGINMLLLILLLTISFPVWGPVVLGILGAVFGIIVAAVALTFAGALAAAGIFVAGIVLAAAGIGLLFSVPFGGLLGLGAGLFLTGAALLIGLFFVWLGIKVLPFIIRGIVRLCSLPFRRRSA